jgi:hypothetical protein
MKTHIVDYLEKLLREFKNIHENYPTKLYLTVNDLTELKEYLNLDFLEELDKYHGCRVRASDKITKSFYE